MLQVSQLSVSYGPIRALEAIALQVQRGEIVALLGANGAGKSTALNALVGLVPAAAGRIVFNDLDITHWPTERIVRAGLTLTPEGRHVFPALTVDENLTLGGATLAKKNIRENHRTAMFELFPILAERRHQPAGTLSGGQQQQLAIARSLMLDPKLLLLDEPSLGLAPRIVDDIFELIERLRSQGLTILLVEQNVAMALAIADRGYVLSNGRISLSGSARELGDSQAVTHAYLGVAN